MTGWFFLVLLIYSLINTGYAQNKTLHNLCKLPNKYACPLNKLIDLKKNPPAPQKIRGTDIIVSSKQLSYTFEAIYRSILGDEKGSQIVFDNHQSNNSSSNIEQDHESASYTSYPAIATIIEFAKERRIVMLNEAHHVSLHRHFAGQLAIELSKIGFTHIAAETFGDVKQLNDLGYPILSSGTYISDPEFGQFIRNSASLGYQFVRYEARKGNREQNQAKNLADFLNQNPDAKLFVYAGYAHINESPTDSGHRWMAELLKDLTDIDPLTIDQVYGTANYKDALTPATYKAVEPQIGNTPKVFMNKDQTWLLPKKYSNGVDLAVFHPREKIIQGRTNWLVNDESRNAYPVNMALLPKDRPLAVKAFVQSEWLKHKHQAIPVDQLLLTAGQNQPKLYLPPGKYTLRAESLNYADIEIMDEFYR